MLHIQPAEVTHVWASYGRGMLRIRISGTVPATCWKARIRQSMIDVYPPQFEAVRFRTGSICLQVVTPYVVEDSFALPEPPGDSIVLHTADGPMDVAIEPGGPPEPRPMAPDEGEFDEAEGRSFRRLSFEEALENAITSLPPVDDPTPDWLDRIEVVGSHVEIGGIAGSHDLVVRVRRARPPA